MDHFILLSLSAVICLLVYVTFRRPSFSIIKEREIIDQSVARALTYPATKATQYGARPRIFIPDVLAGWPWPRQINPHFEELAKESAAWMASLRAFSPKAQKLMDQGKFCLLVCLAHPTANKKVARAACDIMQFMFTFDEYTDKSTPSEVRKLKEMMLDAFRNPRKPRPQGEKVIGEMARQFFVNATGIGTEISLKRIIHTMDGYTEAVVQQSIHREQRRILDVKSYIRERRHTVGATPMFCFNELEFGIPDEVMLHPAIQEMIGAATDMIAFCNDMISYNVEQMRGDDLHNIITCVMNEHHTDVNGAVLWVEDHILGLERKFLGAMESLPLWEEPLNSQVKDYCNGLANWVRGNFEWHFECERYLGNKGPEVRKNKWMACLPKKMASPEKIGPAEVDGSLL